MTARCAHGSLDRKTKLTNCFLYKRIFLLSFRISFYDDNVNQMSQFTRDHMWKCDKSKYLSNNGSYKNNFKTILKFYWGLWHCRRTDEIKNRTAFHRKILVVFADNIGLSNSYLVQFENILCFSKIEVSTIS